MRLHSFIHYTIRIRAMAGLGGLLTMFLMAIPAAFAGPPPCERLIDGASNGSVPPQCGEQQVMLNQLRDATSAFYSFDVGVAAGWDTPLSECVESPAGGMGFHYANLDRLVDGGQLSLLHPEVLLFVPTEDGSMRFVGVEYIIPAVDWTDAAPPEFFGRQLHYNPVQDIWALHVWVGQHNPTGVFQDWNPDVNCAFASD